MKKLLSLLAIAALLTGCATPFPYGAIYTEIKSPIAVGDKPVIGTKVGRAMSTSVLGIVATGDASISTAARNGEITKISHVDYEVRNVLGFIGEYTTVVYGE